MHAKGTLEQVVQSAIDRRFTTYGLSEHMPRYNPDQLYPEEVHLPFIFAPLRTVCIRRAIEHTEDVNGQKLMTKNRIYISSVSIVALDGAGSGKHVRPIPPRSRPSAIQI